MKKTMMITKLTPEDLMEMIETSVRKVMKVVKEPNSDSNEDSMVTQDEAAKLLGVSKKTLYMWRKKKILIFYKVRSQIYYKTSEIKKAIEGIEIVKSIRTRRKRRKEESL